MPIKIFQHCRLSATLVSEYQSIRDSYLQLYVTVCDRVCSPLLFQMLSVLPVPIPTRIPIPFECTLIFATTTTFIDKMIS